MRSLIGICLLIVALIFVIEKAFASDTSYTQERQKTLKELHPDQEVRREPTVQIERYSDKQFRNDETVLIAGGSVVNKHEVSHKPKTGYGTPEDAMENGSSIKQTQSASTSPDIIITTTYEEAPPTLAEKADLSNLPKELAEKVRSLL